MRRWLRIELAGSEGGASRSRMSRWLRIALTELRWGLCMACILICCASTSIFLKGGLYILIILLHWFTYWIIIGIINDLTDCGKQTRITCQGVLVPSVHCALPHIDKWASPSFPYEANTLQQVSNNTDPLVWSPHLTRMDRQHLDVLPLLCLLRDSSVVWDLERLTCGRGFRTPPWLTWCGLKYITSSWKRSRKRTHTHTHTTYSLTDSPIHIHTFPCVSQTNTLELLLHFYHNVCWSHPDVTISSWQVNLTINKNPYKSANLAD